MNKSENTAIEQQAARRNRQDQVIEMRESGRTFREIAKSLNVSVNRARQIFVFGVNESVQRKSIDPMRTLSVRAFNVLWSTWSAVKNPPAGIKLEDPTKDEIIQMIESGILKRARNCGSKIYKELCESVGFVTVENSEIVRCPHCGHKFGLSVKTRIGK